MKALRFLLVSSSIVGSSAVFLSNAAAGPAQAPVVGGTSVPAGEWPDAVAVLASDAMCTGTLIAPDVVLTAGHCIETHPVEVIVGSVELTRPGGMAIKVKSATAYPDWQNSYDVGVLVLDHAAPVAPRAIAGACDVNAHLTAGAKVRVVGFGLTTMDGTGENTRLHQAMLPVIDPMCTKDAACEPAVAPGGEFTAGGGGVDACFGDSGGPIYLDTTSGPALVGVVSRGEAVAGEPCGGGGVYVRADAVASWIEKTTHRKLARTACDAPADGDGGGSDAATNEAGGCSATRGMVGGGALLGLCILTVLCAFPRRQSVHMD